MSLAFITSCRGRLEHVKQSSAVLLADRRVRGHYFFVDSFCPDKSGDWMLETYGLDVHVTKLADLVDDDLHEIPPFNKSLALNTGAHMAITSGYSYLAFLDADTLVTPAMLDFVYDNISPDSLLFFTPGKRDLSGFLVTHQRPFVAVGGYDRRFEGWGSEDLDLRIRLYVHPPKKPAVLKALGGRSWTEIPNELASTISHSDELRGKYYLEHRIKISNAINMNRLSMNFYQKLGLHPADLHGTKLGDDLRRLLDMVDE